MAPKAASSGKRKRTTSKRVLESMESSEAGINGGTLEEANMLPSFGKDDSGQYSEDSPSDNEVAEIMQKATCSKKTRQKAQDPPGGVLDKSLTLLAGSIEKLANAIIAASAAEDRRAMMRPIISNHAIKEQPQGASSTQQGPKPVPSVSDDDNVDHNYPVPSVSDDDNVDHNYISDSGLKLLEIRASDIFKYSLQLMDALFSEEELSSSCYQVAGRGTPSDKPPLSPRRVKCMEDCIKKKFGKQFDSHHVEIRKKCNQKCRDTRAKKGKENTSTTTLQNSSQAV
ncbi:hypothetical protein EMCRGX_G027997 [Ephydatia muelleri]